MALVTSSFAGGVAPAATNCTSPPSIFPVSQVTSGLTGTGLTTIRGTTPTSFDVEVLGVLDDYIWLDIPVIVVRITGPQSFLDAAGGVFFGASGSPVYVNGRWLGSISYLVTYDQTIVGLTPAEDMIGHITGSASTAPKLPASIPLDEGMRRTVARELDVQASDVTGGLERIQTPIGVSGLSAPLLEELQGMLDGRDMGVRVVPSGSMEANLPVNPQPFTPGQPIGSILSWGDYTVWGAGTVSVVCGDEVGAFGHSLFWYPPGDIQIGMTGVDVLAVGDGGGFWFGSMVPSLTEPRGTFIQDRWTGQFGMLGVEPPSVAITSSFSSLDTGNSRDGLTEAIYLADWWFPSMVWGHMVLNLGTVQSGMGPGTIDIGWTIEGTREDGTPFSVSNRTMQWSSWSAADNVWKLVSAVEMLYFNEFEDLSFDSVDAYGSITEEILQGTISKVRLSSPLQRRLAERGVVKAEPGDRVTVEVTLDPFEGDTPTVATFEVKVPRGARGYQDVSIRGGRDRYWSRGINSLDELLEFLNSGQHENDLIVRGFGTQTYVQPVIVEGRASFTIQVVR